MTPLVLALAKFLMSRRGGGGGGGGGRPPMSDAEKDEKYWNDYFVRQNALSGDPIGGAAKAVGGFTPDGFQRGMNAGMKRLSDK